MRILIACFSQTGNTEQIARVVHDEVAGDHGAEIRKIEEVDATKLADYDLVFVGTPIHGGGLAEPTREWLDALPASPGFALAGLVTHMSDVYSRENFERGLESLASTAEEKGIRYLGCFDCQGRLSPEIQPLVQKAGGVSDDDWAKVMAATDLHPDAADEDNARTFAREVLSNI